MRVRLRGSVYWCVTLWSASRRRGVSTGSRQGDTATPLRRIDRGHGDATETGGTESHRGIHRDGHEIVACIGKSAGRERARSSNRNRGNAFVVAVIRADGTPGSGVKRRSPADPTGFRCKQPTLVPVDSHLGRRERSLRRRPRGPTLPGLPTAWVSRAHGRREGLDTFVEI